MHPLIKRYMLFSLAGAAAIILFYGIYQLTSGPKLYEGDRKEERACRLCHGTPEGCDACGYDGKVNVIVPGPNHRTTVYGEVFEQNVRYPSREDGAIYDDGQAFRTGGALQQATAGAIGDAKVVFTGSSGERIEKITPFTGKFSLKLLAGTYKVTVEKSGFQQYEKELVVPLATAEIWQEEIPEVIVEQVLSDDPTRQNQGVPDVLSIEIGMAR
ncbi:MAG: carboxypeptidase regulatory-like domain-containing protein [Planctomycetes bacterium]|nr:carboxypeptidase regulatory-like domain-containing protein [Planctomycetota bacterium]